MESRLTVIENTLTVSLYSLNKILSYRSNLPSSLANVKMLGRTKWFPPPNKRKIERNEKAFGIPNKNR